MVVHVGFDGRLLSGDNAADETDVLEHTVRHFVDHNSAALLISCWISGSNYFLYNCGGCWMLKLLHR